MVSGWMILSRDAPMSVYSCVKVPLFQMNPVLKMVINKELSKLCLPLFSVMPSPFNENKSLGLPDEGSLVGCFNA